MAILAAVSEHERSKQVISVANDLATAYDDTLVALHVVPNDDYDAHRRAIEEIPGFQDFSVSQEVESAKKFASEMVLETLGDVDAERFDPRGRVGDVSSEILKEVDAVDPRYLVISGRRRSPAGKAVFGNTAQQLLLSADCPVVSKLTDQ